MNDNNKQTQKKKIWFECVGYYNHAFHSIPIHSECKTRIIKWNIKWKHDPIPGHERPIPRTLVGCYWSDTILLTGHDGVLLCGEWKCGIMKAFFQVVCSQEFAKILSAVVGCSSKAAKNEARTVHSCPHFEMYARKIWSR